MKKGWQKKRTTRASLAMSTISKRIHKVFVFLDSFRYRIGTNPFAPGRNWNEKERFYSLQEKFERKKQFYLLPGQNWNKGTFLFAPG